MGEWGECTPESAAALQQVAVLDLRGGEDRPALSLGTQLAINFALPTQPAQRTDLGLEQK